MIKHQIICSDGKNIDIPLNIFNKIKNNNNNYVINLSEYYFCDSEAIEKIINYLKNEISESVKQILESKIKDMDQEKKILKEQLNILNEEKSFLNQNLIDNIGNLIGKLIKKELNEIKLKKNKILVNLININKRKHFLYKEYYFNKIFDFKKLNTRQICNILCSAEVLGIDEIINYYFKYDKIDKNCKLFGMIDYYNKDLIYKISNINRLNINSKNYSINYNNIFNNIINN